MQVDQTLLKQAETLLETCRGRSLKLATAESCTGGMIAAVLTEIAGSSDVVERGFVTYSNEAKAELLGVPAQTIQSHGAVSEPVARAMALGAVMRSRADIAVSVTGIAGPEGGSAEKPVGLVHFAVAHKSGPVIHQKHLFGDRPRTVIRTRSVAAALELIDTLIREI
ncbi:MAG: CinA family protein [Fimbriimonadaceae bacterium]|nr:CinA family protein [Alphaproteobacteria bacterium]